MNNAITLLELTNRIRARFDRDPIKTWVIGEITDCRTSGGHYYITLIEKSESGGIAAKLSCRLWRSTVSWVMPKFTSITQSWLRDGMKVMVLLRVEFHQQYGLAGIIEDIDPTFTVGELELQRQETIRRLKEDGVFDMNRELDQPTVIQRIAVISSDTAAGYGDFCNQIHNNGYGYYFYVELFPAIVQGDGAERSIITALEKIFRREEEFDVVALIRGGGSRTDLSCFDNYNLASNIAQFPLPIITGIGHERDNSVVDMVANTRVKTPTAVAQYIINRNAQFAALLDDRLNKVRDAVYRKLAREKAKIDNYERLIKASPRNLFRREKDKIDNYVLLVRQIMRNKFLRERQWLDSAQQLLNSRNPRRLLERGYTFTSGVNGEPLDARTVKSGDKIKTVTLTGNVFSTVD